MSARVFVGDRRVDAVPADDRGLAYGDGLFETMRVHRGDVPWWDAHWARLARGAARLRIPLPDPAQVRGEARALLAAGGAGVLKLLLTRGSVGRGYAPPRNGQRGSSRGTRSARQSRSSASRKPPSTVRPSCRRVTPSLPIALIFAI